MPPAGLPRSDDTEYVNVFAPAFTAIIVFVPLNPLGDAPSTITVSPAMYPCVSLVVAVAIVPVYAVEIIVPVAGLAVIGESVVYVNWPAFTTFIVNVPLYSVSFAPLIVTT